MAEQNDSESKNEYLVIKDHDAQILYMATPIIEENKLVGYNLEYEIVSTPIQIDLECLEIENLSILGTVDYKNICLESTYWK